MYAPNDNIGYISLSNSYVCTLFSSCFKDVKGTHIKETQFGQVSTESTLQTASELLLSNTALYFIQTKINEIHLTKKIILPDDNESTSALSTSTTSMTSKGKVIRVTCNGFRLYHQNKQQLLNEKELDDMHITGACSLIREQYPAIGGLQSPLFQQYDHTLVCK